MANLAQQVDWLIVGVVDASGDPLAGGKVHFYDPGTTNDKTIWTNHTKGATATNPVTLDSNGQALIFAHGAYRIVVKDATDTSTIYDRDNLIFQRNQFVDPITFDDTLSLSTLTVDTDTLDVDESNNRVGIRTTSPASSLDVNVASDNIGISVESGGTAVGGITVKSASTPNKLLTFQGVEGFEWYTGNVDRTSGTSRMILDSSGLLGLGTTTPKSNLHVESSASDISIVQLHTDEVGSADAAGISFSVNEDSNKYIKSGIAHVRDTATTGYGRGDLVFYVDATDDAANATISDEFMRIDGSASRLGIGTTTPDGIVDISGATPNVLIQATTDTASYLTINAGASSDAYTVLEDNGTEIWSYGLDSTDSNSFIVSNNATLGSSNYLEITTSGEVSLPSQPRCRVYNSASQTLTTATETSLTWDSEEFDDGGLHSTSSNTDRLTAPVAGTYLIIGNVTFDSGSIIGDRYIKITYNGTANAIAYAYTEPDDAGNNVEGLSASAIFKLAASDDVVLRAAHTQGSNYDVTGGQYGSSFSMIKIA
jgi:hypothetical protein